MSEPIDADTAENLIEKLQYSIESIGYAVRESDDGDDTLSGTINVGLGRIADAITPRIPGVMGVTEAVMGITDGLALIAEALNNVADAIRESKEGEQP